MNWRLLVQRPWLLAAACLLVATPLAAQEKPFNILNELGGVRGLPGAGAGRKIVLTAGFQLLEGSRKGRLTVEADVLDGWHIYSLTQQQPGPKPTRIKLLSSPAVKSQGPFEPSRDPKVTNTDLYDVPVEEYAGKISWTAELEFAEGVDPETAELTVSFSALTCKDGDGGVCVPFPKRDVAAKFAGTYRPPSDIGSYQAERTHAEIGGRLEPATAQPGDTVTLILTAKPQPSWHVYAWATGAEAEKTGSATVIALTKTAGLEVGEVSESSKPIRHETGVPEIPVQFFHEGPVEWRVPLKVPGQMKPGRYSLAGLIGYQTCTKTQCDQQTAALFKVNLQVGAVARGGEAPLTFEAAEFDDALLAAKSQIGTSAASNWFAKLPFWGKVLIAFAAGLILNVMPCVLPVIGLKILSFVHQAGENHWRIFALNFWFTLGLLFVFFLLASGAVFLNLGWGDHLRSTWFMVLLTGVVMVFSLSFLGVWEIPIPGFVGSGTAGSMAEKEGAIGAFSKGVLTTVLATPCTGPLMVPVLTWAVSQPAWLTYSMFMCIGLGMAFPYLLIGLVPRLVSFLPRPGNWMVIFKQVMGFVLLGTVVFLLNGVDSEMRLATLAMLVGLGFACWIVGKVPLTAGWRAQSAGWGGALVVCLLSVGLSFAFLVSWNELEWKPYSKATLDHHLDEGRTVLVDFTADW